MAEPNPEPDERESGTECNSPQQQRNEAVVLCAIGRSDTEIAEELGVNRSTVWRWRQNPDFAAEVQRETDQVRDAVRGKLVRSASVAVDTLRRLCKDAADDVALEAATALLDRALPIQQAAQVGTVVRVDVSQNNVEASKRLVRDVRGREVDDV